MYCPKFLIIYIIILILQFCDIYMLDIIIKCCIFIICMLPVRTTLHSCLITFAAFWRRSLGKLASFCTIVLYVSLYSSVIFIHLSYTKFEIQV